MTSKLDEIVAATSRQMSLDELMVIIEAEEGGAGDGPQPGDVVTHVEYRDFLGEVVSRQDGRVMVRVLQGWRGVTVPAYPVGIRADRLEVVR